MSKNRLPLFPHTTQIETTVAGEQLTIAGCNLSDLAEHYGTPLYVYDRATLDIAVTEYQHCLADSYPSETGITYAGKAFLCLALAQWIQHRHLWVDCTDLGELRVVTAAGVPRENIILHGVNKSHRVLSAGIAQAGTIVVDNITELGRLVKLAEKAETPFPNLWLRFRPGEAVETHAHIQTGQSDSKFGMDGHEIIQAAHTCRTNQLPLNGLHFHLGSQFRDPSPLEYAMAHTLDLAEELNLGVGWTFCPGGGWGVAYHEDELPFPSIEDYVQFVTEKVLDGCHRRGIPLPRLQLEPGRSLVARAGVAIYRIGTVKRTLDRRWLLLDGGLADNPRFALYQARYTALPASYPFRPAADPAWLAGPYCESGDILIAGLPLPDLQPGELIAIPVSGAYHLSMASNYNGATRPAVLWLEDGKANLIRERETSDDLIRHDKPMLDTRVVFSSVTFHKYQGLGNDYILIREADLHRPLTPTQIQRICDRHYGFGADGILLDCSPPKREFAARFFNPDGSEAEKSGNGLRIYARYLWDNGRVQLDPFLIRTAGGVVEAQVHESGRRVTVMMGPASFDSRDIPVQGPPREVVDEIIRIGSQELTYSAVTVGNPHCVILRDDLSAEEIQRWGAFLENEPRFPNRTNVQFMKVLDRMNIQIEIWERGAGYTLASGSSSCAAAVVAYRLGLCDAEISVHMPGGEIEIAIDEDLNISMTGSVARVWQGNIAEEVFDN